MKHKDKINFDNTVVDISGRAKAAFERSGFADAEDLAQEVALMASAARVSSCKGESGRDVQAIAEALCLDAFHKVMKEARSRRRGLKLMDIENAATVPDVSTPYHFTIANELAIAAEGLDLDSFMMGDTLDDEAHHYGVSRQRAHQIVNEKRSKLNEYLVQ